MSINVQATPEFRNLCGQLAALLVEAGNKALQGEEEIPSAMIFWSPMGKMKIVEVPMLNESVKDVVASSLAVAAQQPFMACCAFVSEAWCLTVPAGEAAPDLKEIASRGTIEGLPNTTECMLVHFRKGDMQLLYACPIDRKNKTVSLPDQPLDPADGQTGGRFVEGGQPHTVH